MKRLLLFYLIVSVLAGTLLSACTSQSSISTTTETSAESLVFPEQGYIRISGEGNFKFQRVFDLKGLSDHDAEAINYEGVTFSAHKEAPGVTTTGPLMYKIDVKFTDGTVETLQYIGLGYTGNIDINLTDHEHPKAGIMLAWNNVSGSLNHVLYLLVSEQ